MTGLTGTSYTPADTLTAGNYSVRTRVLNSTGQVSAWSPAQTFTLLGALPGPTVATGPLGIVADLTPTITWEAAPNAATYELRVTSAGRTRADLTGLTGTAYAMTSDLTAGHYAAGARLQRGRPGERVNARRAVYRRVASARGACADRADRHAERSGADHHLEHSHERRDL